MLVAFGLAVAGDGGGASVVGPTVAFAPAGAVLAVGVSIGCVVLASVVLA